MTRSLAGKLIGLAAAIAAVIAALLALSAVHLLPQLRNPFAETTTDRSGPVLTFGAGEWEQFAVRVKRGEAVTDG